MNNSDGVEKAAAAREARDAVGSSQQRSGRTDEVKAALMHYLTTEQYRERKTSSPPADDERQGPDESS